MKKTLSTILIIFITASAYAETFSIGGKELNIPSPQGYSRVTPEMDAAYRYGLQFQDHVNDLLAYYISDFDIPTAMAGELPLSARYFVLTVDKKRKNRVVNSKKFDTLKYIIKHTNKDLFESLKSKIQYLMKDTSDGISKEFDVNLALQIVPFVVLEPHYETDNAIAFSSYKNYGFSTGEIKEDMIVSMTATWVNISGKLLYLHCYGPQNELEWTRSASKLWAERAIDSNP